MSNGNTAKDGRLARSSQQQGFSRPEFGRSSIPGAPLRGSDEYYQSGSSYQNVPDRPAPGTIPMAFGATLNPPAVHVSSVFVGGHERELFSCHRLSKALRIIAILDAIVVLGGSFFFLPLILMMWGPISGYLASSFQLRATKAFLFYYLLRVGWDIGWLVSGSITSLPVWIFLIVDMIVLRIIYLYFRILNKCTPSEVEQMRDPRSLWGVA